MSGSRDRTRLAFLVLLVVGTVDWQDYFIVLDVPEGSVFIQFGLFLQEEGEAYWDDLVFEVVGLDVPVTGVLDSRKTGPSNLGFGD